MNNEDGVGKNDRKRVKYSSARRKQIMRSGKDAARTSDSDWNEIN